MAAAPLSPATLVKRNATGKRDIPEDIHKLPWRLYGRVSAAALVALGIIVVTANALTGNMADAESYRAAIDRWLAGESPYTAMQMEPYLLHEAAHGRGFVYPPTALPLLLPYLVIPAPLMAMAGAAVLAIVAWRMAGVWAAAIILLLPLSTGVGQVTPWIAAAIGATYLWPRASVASALAGAVKLYPLLAVRWWPAFLILVPLTVSPWWSDWLAAWSNAVPGCPAWSLASASCIGVPWLGYLLAAVFLLGSFAAPRKVGFFLVTVAMILPAPDLYRSYLLIPLIGLLPWAREAAWARTHLRSGHGSAGPSLARHGMGAVPAHGGRLRHRGDAAP